MMYLASDSGKSLRLHYSAFYPWTSELGIFDRLESLDGRRELLRIDTYST